MHTVVSMSSVEFWLGSASRTSAHQAWPPTDTAVPNLSGASTKTGTWHYSPGRSDIYPVVGDYFKHLLPWEGQYFFLIGLETPMLDTG